MTVIKELNEIIEGIRPLFTKMNVPHIFFEGSGHRVSTPLYIDHVNNGTKITMELLNAVNEVLNKHSLEISSVTSHRIYIKEQSS